MTRWAFSHVDTPIGEVFVVASRRGVVRVVIGRAEWERLGIGPEEGRGEGATSQAAAREISLYLMGKKRDFSCPIDPSIGTPFQQRVWRELLKIPYGSVTSYGEVAARIGNPRALRAVGAAARANPVPILIPCHRLLARRGRGDYLIGGYRYGCELKRLLLRIEGVCVDC
jgi:methylated-DNA-[protein]-cysteine S-methyltransferase